MKATAQRQLFEITRVDWETPQGLFDALNRRYGPFDLDVCATAENAKCARYFSPEQDGLRQPWHGKCWMNPPYGSEIGKWVAKAHHDSQGDGFTDGALVVGLLPARTDTAWWHEHVIGAKHAEVEFLRGRLKFGKLGRNSAPFPSAVVVWT